MKRSNLFVISGPSGAGKSSILKRVMQAMPELQFSVSATSRPARPGEENGVQYFFVTEDAFREMIEQGAFVEYDYHMSNYYGTLKSEILKKTQTGSMILDVEPNGAKNVKEIYPDSQRDKYDYVVINDVLDEAVNKVLGIIQACENK